MTPPNPNVRKQKLLSGLNLRDSVGLEIGALCRPFTSRSDGEVIYVDHASTEALKEKYKNDPDVDLDALVHVDAVWGENTLQEAIGGKTVDYVVASHVIEHVPDLIGWIGELRSVLNPSGEVRLIVPDKRFTFDYLRNETRIDSVLYCNLVRARIPQPHVLIDYCMHVAKVDQREAWDRVLDPDLVERHHGIETAIGVARDIIDNGAYHDAHCWVFTPKSFARLFREMAELDLIDFACVGFNDTERYDMEFFVAMQVSSDKEQTVQSWRTMEASARDHVPGAARLSVAEGNG
jgi:SAM-dependent methyltransferase